MIKLLKKEKEQSPCLSEEKGQYVLNLLIQSSKANMSTFGNIQSFLPATTGGRGDVTETYLQGVLLQA